VPPRAGRRPASRLVTLSSDVGTAYAAQMKAVLVGSVPSGSVLDLTHELRPHAVAEAAFVVRAIASRFPRGTVHVVVVDPGVGGARAPVAVACRDGSTLVGPDNGVLAPLAEALGGGRAYRLDPARLRARPRVGTTFDGRDLFAPAAALLARGVPARRLGAPTRLAPAPGTPPRRRPKGGRGTVVHVDRFGNAITDVPTDWLPRGARSVRVEVGRRRWLVPRAASYEAAGRGRLAVLGSSFGTLEVAVGEGRAADRLAVAAGDRLTVVGVVRPRARRNRK
jgi:S-adenosyl-L-methionine hydrolase (adenosine-forming)